MKTADEVIEAIKAAKGQKEFRIVVASHKELKDSLAEFGPMITKVKEWTDSVGNDLEIRAMLFHDYLLIGKYHDS